MTTFINNKLFLNDMENSLEELGLTKIEAKVYLALLKLGSTTTGPLIKKTELHRATVYDVLKRLMEKGLVNYIIKEKTKYFQAVKPEYLLDIIEEQKNTLKRKEELAKKIIKELEIIQEKNKKEQASIFIGKKGIKTIFEDILNYKEYDAFASRGKFKEILGSYFDLFQKKKKNKKIKSRILIDETLRNSDYVKSIYGNIRYLPKELSYPTATFIYNDKIAIIIFTENPTAFLIESKDISKSFKNYFNIIWKIAKK